MLSIPRPCTLELCADSLASDLGEYSSSDAHAQVVNEAHASEDSLLTLSAVEDQATEEVPSLALLPLFFLCDLLQQGKVPEESSPSAGFIVYCWKLNLQEMRVHFKESLNLFYVGPFLPLII